MERRPRLAARSDRRKLRESACGAVDKLIAEFPDTL